MKLHTVIRTAYRSHYRAMLIRLLSTLEFCSGNDLHRPVLDALAIVKKYAGSRLQVYPSEESVPVTGIVRGPWLETVLEQSESDEKINRLAYEVCVLLALCERLRSKELWVEGANRYRNPEEDLPSDFERERSTYYAALKLPSNADNFLNEVKREMHEALSAFTTVYRLTKAFASSGRMVDGFRYRLWRRSLSPRISSLSNPGCSNDGR